LSVINKKRALIYIYFGIQRKIIKDKKLFAFNDVSLNSKLFVAQDVSYPTILIMGTLNSFTLKFNKLQKRNGIAI